MSSTLESPNLIVQRRFQDKLVGIGFEYILRCHPKGTGGRHRRSGYRNVGRTRFGRLVGIQAGVDKLVNWRRLDLA